MAVKFQDGSFQLGYIFPDNTVSLLRWDDNSIHNDYFDGTKWSDRWGINLYRVPRMNFNYNDDDSFSIEWYFTETDKYNLKFRKDGVIQFIHYDGIQWGVIWQK